MPMSSISQSFIQLKKLGRQQNIPDGMAVFYGSFIQRLGFTSGGFPQDIRLINIETNEFFSFRVKPTFVSFKKNNFIFIAKAGTYAIHNYWYTQSKWYGGKTFIEPILKGFDSTDSEAQVGDHNETKQFAFTLKSNTLNYLGTWHFETGFVSFTDESKQINIRFGEKYKNLDFSNAVTILPK
jgi:hypothetical protein